MSCSYRTPLAQVRYKSVVPAGRSSSLEEREEVNEHRSALLGHDPVIV
jgi:hypothetical protein